MLTVESTNGAEREREKQTNKQTNKNKKNTDVVVSNGGIFIHTWRANYTAQTSVFCLRPMSTHVNDTSARRKRRSEEAKRGRMRRGGGSGITGVKKEEKREVGNWGEME